MLKRIGHLSAILLLAWSEPPLSSYLEQLQWQNHIFHHLSHAEGLQVHHPWHVDPVLTSLSSSLCSTNWKEQIQPHSMKTIISPWRIWIKRTITKIIIRRTIRPILEQHIFGVKSVLSTVTKSPHIKYLPLRIRVLLKQFTRCWHFFGRIRVLQKSDTGVLGLASTSGINYI